MKEYEVTVTELLQKTVTVEADSQEEAQKIAEGMWCDGKIYLDYGDYTGVEYRVGDGKEKEADQMIDVLLVEPGQYPRMVSIPPGLESLQKAVDGNIEALYCFDDPVALICNEEGKLAGLQPNRAIRGDDGKILDIIAGTFLICGLNEENFASLPEELRGKFEERFRRPETFLKLGNGIIAIPTDPIAQRKEQVKASPQMEL